ncbi:MAG: hypothetical protein HC848_04420 [Limnobacter sp.]|nr:hypothetical protein [Limnobacter sp.]
MSACYQSVWFRYFFFQWLFQDANQQDLFVRTTAILHNQQNRHHLLTYLRRWALLTVVTFLRVCFWNRLAF